MMNCERYDYIEIACMYRFPVRLTMRSQALIDCIALDTAVSDQKVECIKVDVDGLIKLVVLDDILELRVLVDNAHFKCVSFSD